MPYIGRDLNRGNYLKLDDISSSFDSSTTTFNLTVGGSAFTPGSAFAILVSVGGVIQEPESAYQVNNSEITFANAPTAQDSFFCIALGVSLGIGVPGNGTVNGPQIAKPFNYDGFFYLDDANNRVGINSSAPKVALDVNGNANISGILTAVSYSGPISNASGISTFYDVRVTNNLTVEGSTTTLDTDLTAVDRIEVGANSNSIVGVAITQSGTADILNLYDGSTEVFSVADGGNVTSTGDLTISSILPRIILNDTNHESDFEIKNENGSFRIRDIDNPTDRYKINSSGTIHEFLGSATFSSNVTVIGTIETTGNELKITGTDPQLVIHDTNHNPSHYYLKGVSGAFKITDSTNGDRISLNANGSISITAGTTVFSGSAQVSTNLGVTGNLILTDNIIHDGDTDTKIRFPADDQIQFEAGGNEKLKLDSSGNVYFAGNRSGNDRGIIYNDSNGFGIYGSASGTNHRNIIFYSSSSGSSEKVRITSDGKLLVGATSQTNGSIAEFSKSVAGGGAGCHITVENTSTNSVNNTAGIHLKTDLGTAKFFKYRAAQTFIQSAAGGASELLLQANGAHPMRLYAGDAERVRIHDTGEVHFYGNQTSAPEGDFGFRWDRNSSVNFQITNTNNTSVNAGGRITLKANVGTFTGTYYNNGGFYLINSANGYFNYYSNGILRVNIDINGNFTLNPGSAVALTSSNGGVGKKFGIKSNANNVIIGETESASNFGLILESRVSGRSGDARSSQIGLGNEVIDFYTAPSGSGVIKRMEINSSGNIIFGVQDASTAVTSAAIKHFDLGRDYWNGTKGDYRALRLRIYDNGNIDDMYGLGVSSGELEIQSQSSIGFYASGAGSGTGRRLERFRIKSNGRLLYGDHLNDRGAELQYEGSQHTGIGVHRNVNSHGAPAIQLSASRGTSAGSNTIVQSGDYLGMISFKGTDGSNLASGAHITAIVDGTPGNNDMPARLGFWTSPDGSESPEERLRIESSGQIRAKTLSGSYYPVASARDGSTSARAATSAWEIKKTLGPAAKTGYYYLKNPYDNTVSQWWCDMDTDGGGWILIAHNGDGGMTDQGTTGSHWWHRDNKGGFDTVGSGYKRGGGWWRATNGGWGENTCGELMWDVRIHNVFGTNPSYGAYGITAESNHKVAFRWGTDQPLPTGNSNYSNIPNAGNRRFNEWCREVSNAPGFNPSNYHQNVRSNTINGGNYFTEHMSITWCFRQTSGAADAGDSGPYWFIGQHANGLHQHYEESISGDVYGDGAVQLVSNQDTTWNTNPGGANQGMLRLSKIADTGTVNIWLR